MIDNGELVTVSALVFLLLSTPVVALRLYSRATIRAIGWDDWTMLACQIFFMVFLVLQVVAVPRGFGKHRWDLSNAEMERGMRLFFWLPVIYIPGTVLLKVSVGIFILRFVVDRVQRWAIIIICLFCVMFGVACEFVLVFQCKPISAYWDAEPGGKCMKVDTVLNLSYTATAINMVADLMFAVLPAWIVWQTKMNLRTRISVSALLGLASIAVVATIVRIPRVDTYHEVYAESGDFLWNIVPLVVLSSVEIGLGVIASSAATLRPLFDRCLTSKARTRSVQPSAISLKTYRFDNGDMATSGEKCITTYHVTSHGDLDDMPDLPFPGQKPAYHEARDQASMPCSSAAS